MKWDPLKGWPFGSWTGGYSLGLLNGFIAGFAVVAVLMYFGVIR